MKKDNKKNINNKESKEEFNCKKHHHNINNPNRVIFKMVLCSIILALSVGLSLIEFKIYLPWGSEFDIRIFDTILLFLSISILGIWYSIFISFVQPWLHVIIDGGHSPISMVFYMFSNVLICIIVWIIYYLIFKLNFDFKKTKRVYLIIFASLIIIPLASFLETISIIGASKIMINVGTANKYDSGIEFLFKGNNLLIASGIFFGIYIAKYIFVFTIFSLLENKTKKLVDHYKY